MIHHCYYEHVIQTFTQSSKCSVLFTVRRVQPQYRTQLLRISALPKSLGKSRFLLPSHHILYKCRPETPIGIKFAHSKRNMPHESHIVITLIAERHTFIRLHANNDPRPTKQFFPHTSIRPRPHVHPSRPKKQYHHETNINHHIDSSGISLQCQFYLHIRQNEQFNTGLRYHLHSYINYNRLSARSNTNTAP